MRRRAALACCCLLGLGTAGAATLPVQPGQLAAALRRAADGDLLELAAGDYRGEVGVIAQRRLTLRGIGARPVLHADGRAAEGKAILVVRGGDVRIENLEFRGTRVASRNGAGIRFERGRLLVRRCAFFDNENGILAGNDADAELTVEDSEFGDAPASTPLPHLIYVGRIARFTLQGSRVGGGRGGHLVKTRARVNHIRYNRLVDGSGGSAGYELEFPEGGLAWVIGNVIGKGPDSRNPVLVSFGAEGSDARAQGLFMANNTLVNEGLRPAWFVRIAELGRPVERRLVNNLYVGLGISDLAWADGLNGNGYVPARLLEDVAGGRYGLEPHSLLRGIGVDPGEAHGESLAPLAEFTPPAGTRALTAPARWSPGAVQD